MKAKDLTPGMEVAVGGTQLDYGRRFAIVVRTGRWVRSPIEGLVERDRAPVRVLVLAATGQLVSELRDWWIGVGQHLSVAQLAESTCHLTTETLTNVRSTWADYEAQRAVHQERKRLVRVEQNRRVRELDARADALTAKLGVPISRQGSHFVIGESAARILLGERG